LIPIIVIFLFLTLVNIALLLLLHIKSLKFPNSFLLSSSNSWERFLHNYNIWKGVFMTIVEILQLLQRHLVQVVAQNCVVKVKEFAQVSVNDECAISLSKLRGSS